MAPRTALHSALPALVVVALGCSPESPPSPAGSAGSSAEGSAGQGSAGVSTSAGTGGTGPVTWAEHVAPLVYRECVGCHREGGIAPLSLTSYEPARDAAAVLAEITALREMPPMPVDNSGICNTYQNARWLTNEEISMLGAWWAAGAPRGDPALEPAVPPPPAGLERVDVVIDPGESYTPSNETSDDYRCFVVDPGIDAATNVVAWDVIPGDPRIVHHAIVYEPRTNAQASAAEALDAAEDGPGYTCFGSSRVDADPVALWAPGGSAVRLPADTGLPLASRKVILQVHYNVAEGVFPDRTVVRFETAPTVLKPGSFVPIADPDLMVAPGMSSVTSTRTFTLDAPIAQGTVYGVVPHMHNLGQTLRLDLRLGARDQCLVSVHHWDFHWQNAWWYDSVIDATGASAFTLSCSYDTSTTTEPVAWGDGTADEMCLVYLYVTL
jgi:hypothetical protein